MAFGKLKKAKTSKLDPIDELKTYPRDLDMLEVPMIEGRLLLATVRDPFVEWAMRSNGPVPREEVVKGFKNGEAYLVYAEIEETDVEAIIERNAVRVLEMMLWGVCRDPRRWPKNITPQLALEWLDFHQTEVIHDLAAEEFEARDAEDLVEDMFDGDDPDKQ